MRQIRNRPRDTMSTEIPALRVAPDRILRLPQVCEMTGLRRSFVYELQAAPLSAEHKTGCPCRGVAGGRDSSLDISAHRMQPQTGQRDSGRQI
jgi:hypothetical protein